jgi:uncharacterized protein Yka (UPF0111/DUF47 family)
MNNIDIGKETYFIDCPACSKKVKVSIEQVAKGSQVSCKCGQHIKLHDEGGTHKKAIRNMNSALRSLQNTLKALSR